jgi:biopolymer transport protein ExbD
MIFALPLAMAMSPPVEEQVADRPHYAIKVFGQQQKCWVEFDGRTYSESDLPKLADAMPDRDREVWVSAAADTPYRCIGGAIYSIQKAGFIRIGFVTTEGTPLDSAQ